MCSSSPDYCIGLMSGTSLDAIDAALVAFATDAPPRLVRAQAVPMPVDLRHALVALCQQSALRLSDLARAEDSFCRLQADAVKALLASTPVSADDITAIGSHGQTIEHAPFGHDGGPAFTWQLDNPSLLAELTGCAVVGDLRRRDLAAGGQAAPLAPAFHHAIFSAFGEERVVLNLGGIANLTWLPGNDSAPLGFDTGPANTLLDAWYQAHHAGFFDPEGRWAAGGEVDHALLNRLLSEPFFHLPPPRSTGRELFDLNWVKAHLTGQESAQNVQATLAELTASSVADGIHSVLDDRPFRLITAGGGAHNRDLCQRLARHLPGATLQGADALGWPEDWIEAGAFAWLAHRRVLGLPGNLPSVTGAAGERVLGGLYAGRYQGWQTGEQGLSDHLDRPSGSPDSRGSRDD